MFVRGLDSLFGGREGVRRGCGGGAGGAVVGVGEGLGGKRLDRKRILRAAAAATVPRAQLRAWQVWRRRPSVRPSQRLEGYAKKRDRLGGRRKERACVCIAAGSLYVQPNQAAFCRTDWRCCVRIRRNTSVLFQRVCVCVCVYIRKLRGINTVCIDKGKDVVVGRQWVDWKAMMVSWEQLSSAEHREKE